MQQQIKVTLIRSFYGRKKGHKETVKSLGLRRINHSVIVKNTPCILGMINKVTYLLRVENL